MERRPESKRPSLGSKASELSGNYAWVGHGPLGRSRPRPADGSFCVPKRMCIGHAHADALVNGALKVPPATSRTGPAQRGRALPHEIFQFDSASDVRTIEPPYD
jgi:hypothetical protein